MEERRGIYLRRDLLSGDVEVLDHPEPAEQQAYDLTPGPLPGLYYVYPAGGPTDKPLYELRVTTLGRFELRRPGEVRRGSGGVGLVDDSGGPIVRWLRVLALVVTTPQGWLALAAVYVGMAYGTFRDAGDPSWYRPAALLIVLLIIAAMGPALIELSAKPDRRGAVERWAYLGIVVGALVLLTSVATQYHRGIVGTHRNWISFASWLFVPAGALVGAAVGRLVGRARVWFFALVVLVPGVILATHVPSFVRAVKPIAKPRPPVTTTTTIATTTTVVRTTTTAPKPTTTIDPVFDPAKGHFSTWPYNPAKPPLAIGASGDAVTYLQGVLRTKGAQNQVTVDGNYGPSTVVGVKNLQKFLGLQVTGSVGAADWAAVDRLAKG